MNGFLIWQLKCRVKRHRMSGVSRLPTKYINCSDNFRFVDLKQKVPYIAVMHFGAGLLIFL